MRDERRQQQVDDVMVPFERAGQQRRFDGRDDVVVRAVEQIHRGL